MPHRSARSPLGRAITTFGPALIVLGVGLLAYDGTRRTREAADWVAHSYEVMEAADHTLARLVDAQTGVRGFVLTGQERYLAPYRAAARDASRELARLRELARDSPGQGARVDSLALPMRALFAVLDETVRARRAGRLEAARDVLATGRGEGHVDAARRLIAAIEAHEQGLLAERRAAQARHARTTTLVVAVGAAVAALLALVTNLGLAWLAEAERRTAGELAATNRQLQEQAVELEVTNVQLQEQAMELEAQQLELEQQMESAQLLASDLQRTNAELAAATHAAQTANEAKSAFLATMSHELRTPLNAIGGYVDLLELGIRGPLTETQRSDLASIKRSNQHLLSLINDVLNFARLEAGRVEFLLEDVDVDAVVTDVETLVGPQLRARQLAYGYTPCGGQRLARADPEKLRQILLNLLTNAIKFTAPGGGVRIACEAGADAVTLRVSDTGRGIPGDQLERIFEPFVQVERNRTIASQQGIGLGLAISRDLARGMGGEITVESAVGRGSTFSVILRRGEHRDS